MRVFCILVATLLATATASPLALLAELKPGTRIVSHRFDLGDWPPELIVHSSKHPILLWTVPARSR